MDEHISLNVFMHYNKPMKNIIDYIKEYGNLTFEEYPFNNVDSLILSQISYIKFENSSIDIESEIHLLSDFENEIDTLCMDTRVPELNEELFLQFIHSLRYEAITISHLQTNFDKDNEKQFCAMTYHLPNQTDYIAFRGTDASFVGWKEDFNLCFQENIPSQISALNYVNNYKTNHKLILGGHSKGANLALYAGIHTHNPIYCIYNHDGPGFLTPYQTDKKVFKTIPQSSVIGLLLEETNNYQIIQSDAISILQHDPFTWHVENGDFIYLKQNDQLSKHTQSTLSKWLKSIDVNTRKQVIDTIYSIFSDYENPKDLRKNIDIAEMIKSIQNVDSQTKKMIIETVVLLSKGEVDSKKIRVEFSLEDMDMSEFQDGATYTQIKDYVLEHSGLKVSNLYISQIKRKCGIGVGKNYNLPKSEDSRQPQCPPEKEKAIREAFKYFGMI